MSNNAILHVAQVTKTYGAGTTEVQAVRDVSLEVKPGEVVLINESDLAERAEFVPTARAMEVEALVEGSEINPLSQPAVSVGRELPLVPDGQVKGSAKPVLAPGRRYSPQRSPGRTFPQDSCSSAPAGGGIRGSRTSANADSCPGAAT